MSDRVVKTYLTITSEPKNNVKFMKTCQYDSQKLNDDLNYRYFFELECECLLNNLEFNLPKMELYVMVSLVNATNSLIEHPYTLKCFDKNIRIKSKVLIQDSGLDSSNSFLFPIDKSTMKCKINSLVILTSGPEFLEEYFEKLSIKQINSKASLEGAQQISDPLDKKIETVESQKRLNLRNNLDLDNARLKLQVIIHDLQANKLKNYLTESVDTTVITNRIPGTNEPEQLIENSIDNLPTDSCISNKKVPRILRSSRITGSVNGGDEIFIFTSFVDPDDIQVEFLQFKNDTELEWRAFATIDRIDIHCDCAIVLKTPAYTPITANQQVPSKETDAKVKAKQANLINKVYYRLFKPSTKEYSEKWTFYYTKRNLNELKTLFGDNVVDESFLLQNYQKIFGDENVTGEMIKNKNNIRKRKKNESRNNEEDIKKKKQDMKDETENDEDQVEFKYTNLNSRNTSYDEQEDEDSNASESELIVDEDDVEPKEEKKQIKHKNPRRMLDDSYKSPSMSNSPVTQLANQTQRIKIDMGAQTENNVPTSLTEFFAMRPEDRSKLTSLEQSLRNNLDNCVSKMNALADRTGKALLKLAKTRSLHELLKTQRFLLNVTDEDGNTPIHLCILYGNFDLLEILVDVSLTIPYHNLINTKNHKNLTPLLIGCHLGEVEVCEFLLEASADLNQTDLNGCNPIHIACKNKNVKLLKILMQYVDKNSNSGVLNAVNHDGYAPLHLAVLSESVDIVRELLYLKNLKINIPDKRAGYTALHHAASNRNLLNICNLLVKNENIDIDAKSFNGSTSLHIAIANKNYLIVSLLISNRANLNIQSDLPVHCDVELFQLAVKKNNLIRKCIESYLAEVNQTKSKGSPDPGVSQNSQQDKNAAATTANFAFDINDVKLSQEIKKIYDSELDKEKLDELTESKLRSLSAQHNFDAIYYAQSDPWMLELFKNSKQIRRELLEKIICFERFKKMFAETNHVLHSSNISNDSIKKMTKLTRDKLNHVEKNKLKGQVKISQQETTPSICMEDNENLLNAANEPMQTQ